MTLEQMIATDEQYVMGTYARYPLAVKSGKGCTLTDVNGRNYLDFGSGIGVASIGHCDPDWVAAVSQQAASFAHISNLYYSEPYIRLAEELVKISGLGGRVFFSNSGAEANEGAIKLARKYSFDKYGKVRPGIVTLSNSFHGRTITTLKATGQDNFHNFFFPFTEGFVYAETNSFESIKAAFTQDVCAIMMESVQGEGGVIPLDQDFVHEVVNYAREKDILVIFDEVQAGMGRTGKLFGYQHFDITPDIVTVAKGLGGGLPIGAVICSDSLRDVLGKGHHGSTFGANPVCCAGSLVVVDKLMKPGFIDEVAKKGEYVMEKVRSLNLPCVSDVRGMGLMLGIVVEGDPKAMAKKLLDAGLIVLTAGKNAIRLLPPLTVSYEELDKGIAIINDVLSKEATA